VAKIISLKQAQIDRRGHISGNAECLSCGNEWVVFAPVGVVWFECPKCHMQKGCMKGPCERAGLHWTCGCGNRLFYLTPDGEYCPRCGIWVSGRE
jgi:predicted RNA-binding Zn-ribbon protein involved in translation (DUF1610 family)